MTNQKVIQRNYLLLTLFNTLAASLIWGVNTLFLLDAGLSNAEAFAANAFFTAGEVLFEIPTGVIADTLGRRASYLLGSATLFITTLLYLVLWHLKGPFWAWATVSMLLGLGFTFFSGAVDAWLVDALNAAKFNGSLDHVFARGQIVGGIAMLIGATLGGFVAQFTSLGVPYIIRSALLLLSFVTAAVLMRDLGFTPRKSERLMHEMKNIFLTSFNGVLRNPAIRWMMLITPFLAGVSFYGFYASQPLLLELLGDNKAYGMAGLAASLVAGAQIIGGLAVPLVGKIFSRRTTVTMVIVLLSVISLVLIGFTTNFWVALILISIWGLLGALLNPIRQSYLNQLIPSQQRATILSFDGLLGSTGGVFIQPILGRVTDLWGYPASFVAGGIIQVAALPFVLLAKKENSKADTFLG